jgi:hypothetical protein
MTGEGNPLVLVFIHEDYQTVKDLRSFWFDGASVEVE